MRRREFIALLGGAVAAWPLAARAQQADRMPRIGVLMTTDDAEGQARMGAFLQGLQHLGWVDGRNVRIEARWTVGKADNVRRYVAELAALAPDVIVATGSASVGPLLQTTHAIPIVFAQVVDPVGAGFVESLARPGGNATGFTQYEYGISAKWLELLKEIAPSVTRAAILRDPGITAGIGQWAAIQTVAPALGVELRPVDVRDPGEFERAVAAFARASNGGLIVTGSGSATVHRQRIIMLAARHKLPAVYPFRTYADEGGLISYGPDTIDQFRRAAGYVDRILKGEKPGDLPVQAPTKYELVINLKTAKALGLEISPSLLARADEVIE
jgi:putative ABC transport system substrate-binding protein